jgi:hypothetical protein
VLGISAETPFVAGNTAPGSRRRQIALNGRSSGLTLKGKTIMRDATG